MGWRLWRSLQYRGERGSTASMIMIQLTSGRRIAVAFFASIATVYSYFCAMANGIVAGALIGLPSRVADVLAAQRHAGYRLYVAVGL